MALAQWPDGLPWAFQRNGFSAALEDARLSTETGDRTGRVRRLTSRVPRPVTGAIRMTEGGIAILEGFWRETTRLGTLPFLFPHPLRHNRRLLDRSGGTAVLTEDASAVLIEAWEIAMFSPGADPPTPVAQPGGTFLVSLSLNLMP